MSLIKCSECGKEISDNAKVCIHCGNPLNKEKQNTNIKEKKAKSKKSNNSNKILIIILILLTHIILFAGGTFRFLNRDVVTADVIYPIKTTGYSGITITRHEYECNIVYKYKGIEYHDKLTFNDDNLPKELKNASTNPNFFDVKLDGYIYKNNLGKFFYNIEDYNISKYVFYVQVILLIPSILLIIKNIINLRKNKDKSEKGINKILLTAIILIVVVISGSAISVIVRNNNLSKYKSNNTSDDWGLTINGISINLPCSLYRLNNAGVKLTANDVAYSEVMSTTNQTFSSYGAKADEWSKAISVDLKTGSDLSKKEKNVVVSSIKYSLPAHSYDTAIGITPDKSTLLTSDQFHIKGNITIGSKSEDVISSLGTDYEPKSETNLNNIYSMIYYRGANSTLFISFENGIVREIKISTYSTENVQTDDDLTDNSQVSTLSKNDDNLNNNKTIDNTNISNRDELINSLHFYRQRGWLDLTEIELQMWEQLSDEELKQRLDILDRDIRLQEEYNNKYRNELDEIFSKEIKVNLIPNEDSNYKYIPSDKTQPKTKIDYISVNQNGINAVYYSIEATLTIINKNSGQSTEKVTTKKYKITHIKDLDNIIQIVNFDTKANDTPAIADEISKAEAGYPINTAHSSDLPYIFFNAGDYALYYLPDENWDNI